MGGGSGGGTGYFISSALVAARGEEYQHVSEE
jgi:hypothetical protein